MTTYGTAYFLSTGTHEHPAPPPLGLGHGCNACDTWALHWLSPRQAEIADEHLGELYRDAGDAGPGSITYDSLAGFLEERAREEREPGHTIGLADELADTAAAIRRMSGLPADPDTLDDRVHELVAQGFTPDDARRMAASDEWMAEPEPDERPDLDLEDAAEEALAALERLAGAIRARGARDSESPAISRFSAYHLADLEGNDNGAGWLASRLLADDLRELHRAVRDGDEEGEE